MTATQTKPNPAQAPDARPVTAAQHTPGPWRASWGPCNSFGGISACQVLDDCGDIISRCNPATPHTIALANARLIASAPALLAERDGYLQALETEKMLRASDVRELRAALDEMLACHELRAHKGETFTPLQIKAADVARAALQLARGTK